MSMSPAVAIPAGNTISAEIASIEIERLTGMA
jgi:hypothetical protein